MQIWLKRKSSVICVILSQPKFLHCEVMQGKGTYNLLRGGGAAPRRKAAVTCLVLV